MPTQDFLRPQGEPGLQDATAMDFLLPYLIGRVPLGQSSAVAPNFVKAMPAEDAYGTELREGLMKSMSEPAKGYAMGGIVEPDMGDVPIPPSSFDVANQSSTFKTNGDIPAPPINPAVAAVIAQAAAKPAVAAPMAPHPSMPVTPPPQMPGFPDILKQAQSAGNAVYGDYTPEKRNELYAALLAKANGTPNAVGSTLASVGDAIARGYGHDQTNFLDKTIAQDQASRKEGLEAFDTAQKGTMAATSAGMELQKMDPNSAVSKVTREAYAPMLAKLGYSPAAMAKMTGANVESVAKVAADLGGKEMENLFHQAQLIVESQFHKAELGEKQAARQMDAAKIRAEHPITGMLPTEANKILDQQMTGSTTTQAQTPMTKTINGKTFVNPTGRKDDWYQQ